MRAGSNSIALRHARLPRTVVLRYACDQRRRGNVHSCLSAARIVEPAILAAAIAIVVIAAAFLHTERSAARVGACSGASCSPPFGLAGLKSGVRLTSCSLPSEPDPVSH